MATRYRLLIPHDLYQAMLEQARSELPNECCGLLAGRIDAGVGLVARQFPLINSAASPSEYWSEPRSMLDAEKAMRAGELDLLAIYHSHPTSPPLPSRTDLERNFYGDAVMHLIISLQNPQPELRAWWLLADRFTEAEWRIS